MISISEARSIIQQNVTPLPPKRVPLHLALGLTLAADVYAGTDIPAFPQSSMDGYAFLFSDWELQDELEITGEVAAGNRQSVELSLRTAVRIFTGAAVPRGADTVIMQEKVRTENGRLILQDEKLQPGGNVRPQGSEIRAGELALTRGSRLTPAAMGFLAGIGLDEVEVYPPPSVSIIVTGNELQQPGKALEFGQVYECNSFSLLAALEQLNIRDVKVERVADDPDALTKTLQKASDSDVILLTGGVSVGDYDFVLQAAANCQIDPLFHKIKQRPGKPLYFGKKAEKLVFGLPGNPSSVLTCFYIHVVPALDQLMNRSGNTRAVVAPLSAPCQKAAGITQYLKGHYDGNMAIPLDAQESYRMRSFAQSNCLIQLDEGQTSYAVGDPVKVHLLPV